MPFDPSILVIPGVILAIVLAVFGIIVMISRNWVKVAPNEVAVIYGRKHVVEVTEIDPGTNQPVTRKVERGYRLSKGGGFFKIPILEKVEYLKLDQIQIALRVEHIPDKNTVPITVEGVANIKFGSDEDLLEAAVERFLSAGTDGLRAMVKENLEANMRSIIGQNSVEELIHNRDNFQSSVRDEVVDDLAKMGIHLDTLAIQNITDSKNYIESLGAAEAARVKRDADIAVAEAKRETDEKTAEANRAGQIAKAKADQEISDAERQRDEVKAANEAKVKSEQARIDIRAQQAAAEEQAALNTKEVAAEEARAQAEIKLMDSVRQKNEAEQDATTIVTATKEAEAAVIKAEGAAKAAEKDGEATRVKAAKEGEGNRDKMMAEAEGRIKQADATEREKKADAAGAEAMYMADATGIREKGLAEAEAVEKKAEAYTHLDQSGKVMIVIENLPAIAQAFGEAIAASVKPASEAIGAGMASIGNVEIIDMGGTREDGKNLLTQFATSPVQTMFGLSKQFEATAKLSPVLGVAAKAMGIDVDALTKVVAKAESPEDPDFLAAAYDLATKVKGSSFEPLVRQWMESQGMDPDILLGALEVAMEDSVSTEIESDVSDVVLTAEVSEVDADSEGAEQSGRKPRSKKTQS